jgi:hypothetical protein
MLTKEYNQISVPFLIEKYNSAWGGRRAEVSAKLFFNGYAVPDLRRRVLAEVGPVPDLWV